MLQKANLMITGLPGCGKSTVVNRIINLAKEQGIRVGGISTPEFRISNGRRGGFHIRDVASGTEEIMASVDSKSSTKIGRYGVNLDAVQRVGVTAISSAIITADLIIIDEIGKMELTVPEFSQSVTAALNSSKPVLGTLGMKLRTPFVNTLKRRHDVKVLTLTPAARRAVYKQVCIHLGLKE
ncbi:MAG: NTPase [Candidatus Thorarchaeota archaeon]